MTLGRCHLSVADARDLAEGALRGIGYHNEEARIIAEEGRMELFPWLEVNRAGWLKNCGEHSAFCCRRRASHRD